jgi:imidazole glycerol-phosphate synthase subunit HisF
LHDLRCPSSGRLSQRTTDKGQRTDLFAKRIIPCLDCKHGRVVKGIRFVELRDAGDPGDLAETYNREGADELVMLDIAASRESRATLMDTVHRVACRLFIPLTVGGGVRTLDDARRLLSSGADKVAVNTAAVEAPNLVDELASHFGSQAVVVAIDARARNAKFEPGTPTPELERFPGNRPASPWTVLTYGGSRETGLDAVEWARRVEALGAGEILLTSMDADGTQTGFDCDLTATISTAVHIPVIASGGAGGPAHFAEVFLRGAADAALAASIFHYGQQTIQSLKEYLRARGVPVRLD